MHGPDERKQTVEARIVDVELIAADSAVLTFDVFRPPRYRTAGDAVKDIRYITGHLHNVYVRFSTATGKPWPLPIDSRRERFVSGYVRGDEGWREVWRSQHAAH